MELYVYNAAMQLQGILEDYNSLIWTRRYNTPGDFKLQAPVTAEHLRLIADGNIIMNRGDKEAAQIRYVAISKDSQGAEIMEAQGRFLTDWCNKRIIEGNIDTEGAPPALIGMLINNNIINPANNTGISDYDDVRKIPNVSFSDGGLTGTSASYTVKGGAYVGDEVSLLAKLGDIGYRMETSPATGSHLLKLYRGADRSAGNGDGNAVCVFAPDYDNVIEQEYTVSSESSATVAYVMSGDGICDACNYAVAGLERTEVFISASDLKFEYTGEDINEYFEAMEAFGVLLNDRGLKELADMGKSLTFSSKINAVANHKYRINYDLGDKVTCLNRRWGIQVDARITEITETYEAGRVEIDIVFGEAVPVLRDKIKKMIKGG